MDRVNEAEMELISVREAARRLGVSDTAVHKAIKAGRIQVANRTANSNRPKLSWPSLQTDWIANSDQSKRSHGGVVASVPKAPPDPMAENDDDEGQSYAKSRAVRESYQALLAQLEYEERAKILVNAEEVKVRWTKLIVAAKTRILGIPASCKTRIADLPLPVLATIEAVCREALENLANERSRD